MKRHLPLVGLCLAVFLVMTGMGAAAVALPAKYLQVSGSMGSSGWLAAAFAASYMLVQVPSGCWADRRGYRPVLVLGCLLIALAALVFKLADNATTIYVGRFIQGLGEAPIWALAPALLGRLYPASRGRAMGLYNAAFHLGLMLGPVVGASAAVLAGADPFLMFATASLGAAVLILVAVPGTKGCGCAERIEGVQGTEGAVEIKGAIQRMCGAKGDGESVGRGAVGADRGSDETEDGAVRHRVLWGLWPVLLGVPLFGAAYGLLVSCLPVYLASEAGFTPARLGTVLFATYAGIALGQMGGGALSDRYGRVWFAAGGLLLTACGLFGFILPGVAPMVAGSALGLGLGTFAVASLALVNDACGANREGQASSLYFLGWGTGYFAGPLGVNLTGLEAGGMAIAAVVFAAAVLAFGYQRRAVRRE